jgi:hypothetical protein
MTKATKSPCPLCGRISTLFLLNYETWQHYFCDSCGEFEVTKSVLKTVQVAPADTRAAISSQAKALPHGQFLKLRAMSGVSLVPGNTQWVAEVAVR